MRWIGAFLLGLAGLAATTPASAQGAACATLTAQLAAVDRAASGFDTGNTREVDRKILRQRQEIDRATVVARRAGCMGGVFSSPKGGGQCRSLAALINRMKANLNRLNADRRQVSGNPLTASRERSRLVRQLANNGCGEYAAYAPPARRGLFSNFFGSRPVRGGFGPDGLWYSDRSASTYRTLCVRTCDGYYFPISFATVASRFETDAEACRALCPAADTQLYIHRSPGEESDSMVSLSGEPYSVLPAAFRYRRQFDSTCTCGTPAIPASPIAGPLRLAPKAKPYPLVRVVRDDPETVANRGGGFVPQLVLPGGEPVIVEEVERRAVRVVGPANFVAQ